ncbi:acyl-protein thioesterase 1-like [Sycon ciliatum]|uniref:acyl-protein thioesterase 1-like n=1 Tax=Sycon ciliatum TaxID=27933 RepID=UPI0020ABDC27|eukprot:scpid37488/ scgid34183/ Acyl-protein thioesterase 1; Calcium-independent phospholipase A2; Lysophospholipase 1; Lysophospholipase I; Acyl-protein thioesterase 1; Lysophospholipase 1; Lysophospholipase I
MLRQVLPRPGKSYGLGRTAAVRWFVCGSIWWSCSHTSAQSQTAASSSCPTRSRHTSSSSANTHSRMPSKPVIVEPKGKHSATLIFLHGLGDTGHGWSESFRTIQPDYLRIVCPNAPTQSVTLNMGMSMPSWFDIFGLGANAKQDEEGIKKAAGDLKALIEEEEKRVPAERIVIGGFSQGGAVALLAGLSSAKKLAGIAAFSTWLPIHEKVEPLATDAGRSIPILQCHGGIDPMVSITVGQMTAQGLSAMCKTHELKVYPNMQHSSSLEELQDLRGWLGKRVPPM